MISNIPFYSFKKSSFVKKYAKQMLLFVLLTISLIFIYEELERYLDEGFVSDPDLSFEIELENVKTRLALDYQKRKLNETAVRLKEEEEHTDTDKNIIASLMLEIVEITENIKNLERSEVN